MNNALMATLPNHVVSYGRPDQPPKSVTLPNQDPSEMESEDIGDGEDEDDVHGDDWDVQGIEDCEDFDDAHDLQDSNDFHDPNDIYADTNDIYADTNDIYANTNYNTPVLGKSKHVCHLLESECPLEDGFDVSPDEDEDRALAVIHGSESFNVLDMHHQRNGRPRPPNPQDLDKIRRSSQPQPLASPKSVPNKNKTKKQHKWWRPQATITNPTILKFYPPRWHDALERAKNKFRLFLTTVNGFPSRSVGLEEAVDCLKEALEDFRKMDKRVEKGAYAIFRYSITTKQKSRVLQKTPR